MAGKTGLDAKRMFDECIADVQPDSHLVHARLAMYDHFDDVSEFEKAETVARRVLSKKDAPARIVGEKVAAKLA